MTRPDITLEDVGSVAIFRGRTVAGQQFLDAAPFGEAFGSGSRLIEWRAASTLVAAAVVGGLVVSSNNHFLTGRN